MINRGPRRMLIPQKRAILWDMDGVLVDSSPVHVTAWKQVLSDMGIQFDSQKFKQIYGLKNSEFLKILVPRQFNDMEIKSLVDQKEAQFRKISRNLKPIPGVIKWLNKFKSMDWRQAIASAGEPENIEYIVDILQIREYFDALVTPGDLPGKPDPAIFIKASQQLEISPKYCLVIEDSVPGIKAARQANMHCIAVSSTNSPVVLSNADIVVESFEKLTFEQVVSIIR
jgi:beta-phosphoglucomutase